MVRHLQDRLEQALRDLAAARGVTRVLFQRIEEANSRNTAWEFECDELRHLLRVRSGGDTAAASDPLLRDSESAGSSEGDTFIVRGKGLESAWERLIFHATEDVTMVTPVFTSDVVADALCAVRRRDWWNTGGVQCRLLVSGELMDRDNNEGRVERILRLRDCGVRVRHYRNGCLHQRSLLADRRMYVGSSGFMQAVADTVALGVVIPLSEEAATLERLFFDALWHAAESAWTTESHGLIITDIVGDNALQGVAGA